VGDAFALLTEKDAGSVPVWQQTLQASLGGTCIHPLHITCQRVSPGGDARMQEVCRLFRDVFAPLQRFSVYGDHLEIWYSEWRDDQIAKCLVQPDTDFAAAARSLDRLLDERGIQRHYRVDGSPELVPVTVLEGVHSHPIGEKEHRLVQRHLFSPTELVISRIIGPGRFEILERTPLAPPP
jgi:hypothetical protein